jgi:hypothetical protein
MPHRYVCGAPCYRSFPTTRALVAHRLNRTECRERWDAFLLNLRPDSESSEDEATGPPANSSADLGLTNSNNSESGSGSESGSDSSEEREVPVSTPMEPQDTDEDDDYEQVFPGAGHIFSQGVPPFLEWRRQQESLGRSLYYPFAGPKEWRLVCWLHASRLPQSQIDDFLRLGYVRHIYSPCGAPH